MKNKIIGVLTQKVVDLLNLNFKVGEPIYIGDSNLEHIKRKHPNDYKKYSDLIREILTNPEYIAKNPHKQNSTIEYIKREKEEYILVVVRATAKGKLFVRTLFVMDPRKVKRYKSKQFLISYK